MNLAPSIDTILAPACKALFGGLPSELSIALRQSSRLRSSFARTFALSMFDARRDGDVAKAERVAANTLAAIEGGA